MGERDQILRRIEEHRASIEELEGALARLAEAPGRTVAPAADPSWPPKGFYLTFYVVAGLLIGILASLVSFLFNVFGSLLIHQDPMKILRVYGTVFLGPQALTTDDLNFFMLVAIVHFSVGAVAGAVFHVLVNYFVPERTALQVLLGALYGLLLWFVNHYVVIAWLQPRLWGQAFVLELMPAWVAIATHVLYGVTLGALQRLGRFQPYRPAALAVAA